MHSTSSNEVTSKDVKTSAANLFRRDSILMDSIRKHPVNTTPEKDLMDTPILTKNIRYNLFSFHNVTLSEPFSVDSALTKLFPGSYYKLWRNGSDSVVFEGWRCKSCTKLVEHGWESDDTVDIFPYPDSNETQIVDTLLFTCDGKRNIIMSFNTSEFQTDYIGCGRTTCAFLGLALFTEEGKKWILKAFTPAVGYYGMFQQVPKIELFRYSSGNVGCYIGNSYGSGGGPYFSDAYFFGVIGNTFKVVLEKDNVCRSNVPADAWDTYQQIDSTQFNKQFPDILFSTSGDYSKDGFDIYGGDDTSETPDAIKQLIRSSDTFDFDIKARYTFNGIKYKLAKQTVTTSPYKPMVDDSNFRAHW